MKKITALLFLIILCVFSGTSDSLEAVVSLPPASDTEPVRKLVVWKEGTTDSMRAEVLGRVRATLLRHSAHLPASVAVLQNTQSVKFLEENPNVLRIEDDITMYAYESSLDIQKSHFSDIAERLQHKTPTSNVASLATDTLPWGIDTADAEKVWPLGNTADIIKVAILDTGISTKHTELKPNVKGCYNAISLFKNCNDLNGHGSHVAGTIGAVKNGKGVVGMAPQVDLYAVKVLNDAGWGYMSDIIEGIMWAATNNMDVINLSLGASTGSQSMHDAVVAAKNAGVVVVAAAGNNGGAVGYPAAYPEVIAVSAIDQNKSIASFSSRGPEIDLAAPGVNIYSTYKGTGFATLSGTSMATPHVVGAAALVMASSIGSYDENGNTAWDPSEVIQKLKDRALDLGVPGDDPLYGAGMVKAYESVLP